MLELHYPTVIKTILERQYPGKPTLKVASGHFGASISRKTNFKSSLWKWQRRHFRKLHKVARFSLRDVTMAKIVRTNKLPSSSPPPPPHPAAGPVLFRKIVEIERFALVVACVPGVLKGWEREF